VAFFTMATASSLPAPSAAAAKPAKIIVAAMAEASCVDALAFIIQSPDGCSGGQAAPRRNRIKEETIR
jgi:hypothetical protein